MIRRALVYCRISRDRVGAGLGVDRQEADCRQVAERLGWQVVAVHVDNDLSASNGKPRPGYAALLADLEAGAADAVLAWHTDRLHRRPVELEHYISVCEARAIPTVTVQAGPLDLSTPSGRMVARMLGSAARFEVEHASERQRRARLQAAADGRWSGGGRPFGYQADGVTVVEAEAAELRAAGHAVLAGVSLRRVAGDLNGRGVSTSTGRPWRPEAVRKVLLRARNAGLVEHRGEVVGPAQWPAVVDEDTWKAVRAVLTDPARRTGAARRARWLLSGLARCGVCGKPVVSRTVAQPGRRNRAVYACLDGRHVVRDAVEVDQYLTAVILERLSRPDAGDLLAPDRAVDTAGLHTRAVMLRQRLDGLAVAYSEGAIDARQLNIGSVRLRAQLADVDEQVAAAYRGSALDVMLRPAKGKRPDPAAVWEALDLERRRAVVEVLVEVTILPGRKGRRPGWRAGESYFDPATVRVEPKRG